MQANGSTTASLTLNSTTLTTNNITRTSGTFNTLSITGTSGKPTTAKSRCVFIGSESASAAGIDICSDTWQYIDVTTTNTYSLREELFTLQQPKIFQCMSTVTQQQQY